jgi:uncharacterized protein YkwD
MLDTHTPHSSQPLTPPSGRALRQLAAVMAAIVVTLMTFTSAALAHGRGCQHARTPIAAGSPTEMRKAVVCLVNQQRTAHRLPKLAASGSLDLSAQKWTNDMVSNRDFSHGADFSARISAAGFDWSSVGENIAGGFATPAAVVSAWMASPGHCANILSPIYREVGTGVSNGSSVGGDAAGTWTQDFGLQMGQHPASGNYGPAQSCSSS